MLTFTVRLKRLASGVGAVPTPAGREQALPLPQSQRTPPHPSSQPKLLLRPLPEPLPTLPSPASLPLRCARVLCASWTLTFGGGRVENTSVILFPEAFSVSELCCVHLKPPSGGSPVHLFTPPLPSLPVCLFMPSLRGRHSPLWRQLCLPRVSANAAPVGEKIILSHCSSVLTSQPCGSFLTFCQNLRP